VLVANLLLRVAALSLIVYCVASMSVLEVLVTETERTAGPDAEGAAGLVAALGWVVVGGLLLVALLLLLLAWRNNQRSRGARAWTFVIGLSLLCCCLPLGLFSDAGNGAVDADRFDFERRVAAAMPPWYEPVSSATGLILGTALLAALVLLVLPPANRYFRLPPPAVFYYPYYPHYPYPPRT
jgi:hypothetical protein